MDTDLWDSNASFLGEEEQDYSGRVAGAGDVNGDGYDDILISATLNDEGALEAGQTYLILGKASGWAMDTDLSKADASFWGEDVGDRSGLSAAGAGDVNGDGYDDILIGAFRNDEKDIWAGQTYLILGKASGWSMDTNLSNSDASFLGETRGDHSGYSVAGAGDVDGDGYDDILIGAYGNGEGGGNAGQTYLILGKESGWSMDTDLSNSDASFWGEDPGNMAGWPVAGAGDVNGDGYDDILIGAAYLSETSGWAAQTYLILGKESGWSMDTDLSNADALFLGDADGGSGRSVAGAGDVNGDGYDDILIGVYNNDEGGSEAGQTYLILGKESGWSKNTNLSKADASFWGEAVYDWSGQSVAGAGDVNRDGYDDILIGATYNDEGGTSAGQTYLILGKESGWSMDTNLSTANASFWGEGEYDYSGYSVAWAGDVNGDGADDILIGASFNSDGGDGAGQTYLIFGEPVDTDLDDVPDYRDAFPLDPAASLDTDTDGSPDEWNGGVSQVDSTTGLLQDAFPLDIAASMDTDSDGYPDEWNPGMSANNSTSDPKLILDTFPDDPSEWNDTDGDGHGDNGDVYPDDPLEWVDTDNDTIGDNGDAFPDDAAASNDTDGDGYPDEWNPGKTKKDSTTGLNIDEFPDDPKKWKKTEPPFIGLVGALMAILVAALVAYNRRMHS